MQSLTAKFFGINMLYCLGLYEFRKNLDKLIRKKLTKSYCIPIHYLLVHEIPKLQNYGNITVCSLYSYILSKGCHPGHYQREHIELDRLFGSVFMYVTVLPPVFLLNIVVSVTLNNFTKQRQVLFLFSVMISAFSVAHKPSYLATNQIVDIVPSIVRTSHIHRPWN